MVCSVFEMVSTEYAVSQRNPEQSEHHVVLKGWYLTKLYFISKMAYTSCHLHFRLVAVLFEDNVHVAMTFL